MREYNLSRARLQSMGFGGRFPVDPSIAGPKLIYYSGASFSAHGAVSGDARAASRRTVAVHVGSEDYVKNVALQLIMTGTSVLIAHRCQT